MRVRAGERWRHADGSVSVRVEVEISRQMIAARDAYMYAGQRAQLRLGGEAGEVVTVDVSSPPFDDSLNWLPLYRLRGDIPTGSTRTLHRSMRKPMTEEEEEELRRAQGDDVSITSELDLFFYRPHEVTPRAGGVSAARTRLLAALEATSAGDEVADVEIGPFVGNGIDFRKLIGTFMYRKLLFFAQASHVHLAKACIEDKTPHGLELAWREENRLYIVDDAGEGIVFDAAFSRWQDTFNTLVRVASPGGRGEGTFDGSPEELFDNDDLEYFPDETGVVIFGDVDFVRRIRALAAAAEISDASVLDSLTSVRTPVKILRAEQIDAYCPPDRLDEVPDFERELKETGKSTV